MKLFAKVNAARQSFQSSGTQHDLHKESLSWAGWLLLGWGASTLPRELQKQKLALLSALTLVIGFREDSYHMTDITFICSFFCGAKSPNIIKQRKLATAKTCVEN